MLLKTGSALASADSLLVAKEDEPIIERSGLGLTGSYGFRSGGGEGVNGRIWYEAPFGSVLISAGVIGSKIADSFFGFDLSVRRPLWYLSERRGDLVTASIGFNACVWSNTVTLGVPLGMIFHFPVTSFCALEPGIVLTPNFPLTKPDKNTVITAVQLGLRF
jgi:hypothetical protein